MTAKIMFLKLRSARATVMPGLRAVSVVITHQIMNARIKIIRVFDGGRIGSR
jgi:hypothetical protein